MKQYYKPSLVILLLTLAIQHYFITSDPASILFWGVVILTIGINVPTKPGEKNKPPGPYPGTCMVRLKQWGHDRSRKWGVMVIPAKI